jgi:CxxC-x17-CxxC domain-containing protein
VGQYTDKTMSCRDCGKQFTFTAGEQEFYASRGFSEPTRCGECRAARKASRDGGADFGSRSSYSGASTGSSRSSYGSSSGSGRDYSSSRSSGSRDYSSGGARQMYKAVCADCGVTTEVPFEPRQGRPVYCRDCFEKRNPRR